MLTHDEQPIDSILHTFSDYLPAPTTTRTSHQQGEKQLMRQPIEHLSPNEISTLIHDLRVHQVELATQNEELRHIQEELEASRARYFNLYDLAPVGYLTLSQGGTILEANLTAADMLGTPKSCLLKQRLSQFIVSEDQATYYHCLQRLLATNMSQSCDFRMQPLNGTLLWVHLDATLQYDSVFATNVCSIVITDITPLKQTEQCLRESEERLRQANSILETRVAQRTADLAALNQRLQQEAVERRQAENEREQLVEQLRQLHDHIQLEREADRCRIAREIHDEFGQILIALKMDITWLKQHIPRRSKLMPKLQAITALMDSAFHSIRSIVTELRPSLLDELGIVAAIDWQMQEFALRTNLECELHLDEDIATLPMGRATALFRILQAALSNIVRHADATQVKVTLEQLEGVIIMTITDNGKGIEPANIDHPLSLGLLGMRERARSVGGVVHFEGQPNHGASVIVRIPQNGL